MRPLHPPQSLVVALWAQWDVGLNILSIPGSTYDVENPTPILWQEVSNYGYICPAAVAEGVSKIRVWFKHVDLGKSVSGLKRTLPEKFVRSCSILTTRGTRQYEWGAKLARYLETGLPRGHSADANVILGKKEIIRTNAVVLCRVWRPQRSKT